MKLERLPYEPGSVLGFFEEGLTALGALCDRTWHDRLEVVAEARAASLWDASGSLFAGELHFAAGDATVARDAAREVFPGSPLTFKLAEALQPSPLALERLVLPGTTIVPMDTAVLERHWRGQFPHTERWRMLKPFEPGWHFSLIALVRVEVQAIEQHWFLHRAAVALPGGEIDQHLAQGTDFLQPDPQPPTNIPWPPSRPQDWSKRLLSAIEQELSPDLAGICARQQAGLKHALERVDDYFEHYASELENRRKRSGNKTARIKTDERLAAARAEHARRRADQVARHEIRIVPHIDALLLAAEPAFHTQLLIQRAHASENLPASYVPRSRCWYPARTGE